MGDPRRFHLFADLIRQRFETAARVADVAAGRGMLQAALRLRGFKIVTSWDKRQKYASPRRGSFYRYGLFDAAEAPPDYDLVVGMHPDQATDHIISYALRRRIPFAVCPCCIRPSAVHYGGAHSYRPWMAHLLDLGRGGGFRCEVVELPMRGAANVIVGVPAPSEHARGASRHGRKGRAQGRR